MEVHVLIPRTYDCANLHGKRSFVIKLKKESWIGEIILAQCNHLKGLELESNEGDVMTEAEVR